MPNSVFKPEYLVGKTGETTVKVKLEADGDTKGTHAYRIGKNDAQVIESRVYVRKADTNGK